MIIDAPYVYRHPVTGEWVTGNFATEWPVIHIPVREAYTQHLLTSEGEQSVDMHETTNLVLELHELYRCIDGNDVERLHVFAESTVIAEDWINGTLLDPNPDELLFSDHPWSNQPMAFGTMVTWPSSVVVGPTSIPLYETSNEIRDAYSPAPRTEEDVVARSAYDVDDHQYDEALAPSKPVKSWDKWLEDTNTLLRQMEGAKH